MRVLGVIFFLLFSFFGLAQTTESEEYVDGYYLDLDSNKIEGKIHYAYSWYSWFKFKPTADAKPQTIEIDRTLGFNMEGRNFVIKENFGVSLRYFMKIRKDFVEVIDKGEVVLYKHYSSHNIMNLDGSSKKQKYENYLIERKGKLITGHRNENTFAKQMALLIEDNSNLSQQVKNKELRLADLEYIVKEYNAWFASLN